MSHQMNWIEGIKPCKTNLIGKKQTEAECVCINATNSSYFEPGGIHIYYFWLYIVKMWRTCTENMIIYTFKLSEIAIIRLYLLYSIERCMRLDTIAAGIRWEVGDILANRDMHAHTHCCSIFKITNKPNNHMRRVWEETGTRWASSRNKLNQHDIFNLASSCGGALEAMPIEDQLL